MVRDAADLVSRIGKKAFPEFRKKGTRWHRGERYLFIYDQDGVCRFNAGFPSLEGKDLSGARLMGDRPVGRWVANFAAPDGAGEGWVHFPWVRPGMLLPLWKSAYVVRAVTPEGEPLAVGSGLYNINTERRFLQNAVDMAVALLKAEGLDALDEIRDESGPMNWGDTYVYVIDEDGRALVDPGLRGMVDRNVLELVDAVGHKVVRTMFERLRDADHAWVKYMWPRPGESVPSQRIAFVRKVNVDGRTLVVGSDMFLEAPIWMRK